MKPKTRQITDTELRDRVIHQLDKEPKVISTDIGVGVSDGIVTLTGYVYTEGEKSTAERVAKDVPGVKFVTNDIMVRAYSDLTDKDIAKEAKHMLSMDQGVPEGSVVVTVKDGEIILEGEVDYFDQKEAAERALRHLPGIRGIINEIKVKPAAQTNP